jgi:hypothetical protein
LYVWCGGRDTVRRRDIGERLGAQDERRVVLWVRNKLQRGRLKLSRGFGLEYNGKQSKMRTSSSGKSAAQRSTGIHDEVSDEAGKKGGSGGSLERVGRKRGGFAVLITAAAEKHLQLVWIQWMSLVASARGRQNARVEGGRQAKIDARAAAVRRMTRIDQSEFRLLAIGVQDSKRPLWLKPRMTLNSNFCHGASLSARSS